MISNQNYNLVSEEYKRIQTFTGNILENLSLALITIDAENNIVIFNRSAFEIMLIPFQNTKYLNIESVKNASNDIYQFLNSKTTLKNYEVDTEINGIKKTLMLNSTSIEKADSTIDTYSLLIEDITEIRKIGKQLNQNEKFTAMGELASGVAHEIRNPLNTIYMISQRLDREYKNKLNSEDFNSLTEILHSESQRVNSIIEQFLRFTKPVNLIRQTIKVSELLDEIMKILRIQAEAKNIIVNTIIESDENVNIDYQQMKQVFINLFRNSIDATNQGGKIEIKFYKTQGKSVFEINDTGTGISKENLKKIFDIYFTTKSTGTGMGLSIVRQIILQHGGTIDVESNIDKGTKFIITLP
jgi:signal transduction histidine kinase